MHLLFLSLLQERLMIEPTESESKAELDRFCDALISIRKEIDEASEEEPNNVLKNSPHTLAMLPADEWNFPYSRQKAAYPIDYLAEINSGLQLEE